MKQAALLITILIGSLAGSYFLLTGSLFPKTIRDQLESPHLVSAINTQDIQLSDGRLIQLKDAALLRAVPVISEDILTHGVEIDASGELYSLVRIHHWCGNDPVRYHLAKVNLNALTIVLKNTPNTRISKHGLDPGILGLLLIPPDQLHEVYKTEQGS